MTQIPGPINPSLPPDPGNAPARSPLPALFWWLLAAAVFAAGAGIRLRLYLYNRSMFRDEAALALNIVHRSFRQLFTPLDNDQGSPIGFLLIEKLVVTLFKNHEWSLRLIPLTASILALPLLYWLSRKLLTPGGAILALLIIAMGEKQYDYSCDTKQYATDVFFAIALLLLAMIAMENRSRRAFIALAISGALAIWCSHPAVFVLAGIGAMIAFDYISIKPRSNTAEILGIGALWIISFALNYWFILRRLSTNHFMQSFWTEADAFAPIPRSLGALIWYKKNFFEIFEDPLSLGFVGLAALVFLLGIRTLFLRRKSASIALLLPIILVLAASAAHKYPFRERLILFIGPSLAIFIGAGFEYLFESPRRLVGIIALIFLLITPLDKTAEYAKSPLRHSDMRKVASLIAANRQPGDEIYVYEFCYYPYAYYRDTFKLNDADTTRGSPTIVGIDGYKQEFAKYAGKRVWVMFEDSPEHQQPALAVLDQMGKRVFEARPFDDYVACYDLR